MAIEDCGVNQQKFIFNKKKNFKLSLQSISLLLFLSQIFFFSCLFAPTPMNSHKLNSDLNDQSHKLAFFSYATSVSLFDIHFLYQFRPYFDVKTGKVILDVHTKMLWKHLF